MARATTPSLVLPQPPRLRDALELLADRRVDLLVPVAEAEDGRAPGCVQITAPGSVVYVTAAAPGDSRQASACPWRCWIPGRVATAHVLHETLLGREWQRAHALSARCKQSVGNGRRDNRGRWLADAAWRLAALDEVNLELGSVVEAQYSVVVEVGLANFAVRQRNLSP